MAHKFDKRQRDTPDWLKDAARIDPSHPLRCRKPRIADRIVLEKLIQVL
jgi:hypothetical protein